MKDRVPTYPGRVTLTPVSGQANTYDMVRADQPAQEGTPLNKASLLSDATSVMLGGDPETMLPDDAFQRIAGLAVTAGGGGDTQELEDTEMEVGSFVNAGAGWNTYKFREAFEDVPQVILQAEAFEGIVEIKDITADGFLYCLRSTTVSGGKVTTDSYFTAIGASSSSLHTENTLVKTVALPSNGTTTEDAIKINYIAFEYGGER